VAGKGKMTQNIHARSNAIINKVMEAEVTVKMTRSEAAGLAMLLKDRVYVNENNLTSEEVLALSDLHKRLLTA